MEDFLTPEAMEAIGTAINTIIIAFATVASGLIVKLLHQGAPMLLNYLEALSHRTESEAHSASFKCATEKIVTLADAAVLQIDQEFVRKHKKEGTWSPILASEAREKAVYTAMKNLGQKGLKEMEICLGYTERDVRSHMTTMIEAKINAAKK